MKNLTYRNKVRIKILLASLVIFLYGYLYFATNFKQVDFQEYKTEVELVNYDFEKHYEVPEIYSTKQELNKIIVDLIYFHNEIKYESTTVLYRKYISPQLERFIENKETDKLDLTYIHISQI